MRPQARRSGGPTCTSWSCQRPAAHHVIHHSSLIDTNTPPLCRTPACCAAGLGALPAAPRQLGCAACAMSAPCLRPSVHPASVLPAACMRPACCLRLSLARPGGGHASSTRQLSRQNASRSRAYCRWRAAAPPAAAGLRRLRWRLISAWWPPWRCSSPWPWHQAGA